MDDDREQPIHTVHDWQVDHWVGVITRAHMMATGEHPPRHLMRIYAHHIIADISKPLFPSQECPECGREHPGQPCPQPTLIEEETP